MLGSKRTGPLGPPTCAGSQASMRADNAESTAKKRNMLVHVHLRAQIPKLPSTVSCKAS